MNIYTPGTYEIINNFIQNKNCSLLISKYSSDRLEEFPKSIHVSISDFIVKNTKLSYNFSDISNIKDLSIISRSFRDNLKNKRRMIKQFYKRNNYFNTVLPYFYTTNVNYSIPFFYTYPLYPNEYLPYGSVNFSQDS